MAEASVTGAATPSGKRARPAELNVFLGLVAIVLAFELLGWLFIGQSFVANRQRLTIIILQVSTIGIIAVGVTQVIITGGIDLSSGSIVGATAMIAMSFAQSSAAAAPVYPDLLNLPVIIPIVVALGLGMFAGSINGGFIAYTGIPPFIATLGMMVTARGVAKWYTNGKPVSFPTEAYASIANGDILAFVTFGNLSSKGLNPVIIFALVAILFHLALKYTLYGKHTYAIGSNEEAARVSGINVERHKVLVYAIAGLLAGLAALVLSSKNLTAQAGMGVMYELDAIAMAVIGGVSLSGGRGSIVGTVIGALIFGVIISGFTFLRIDAYYQEMIKGAIIVTAVVADVYRQRRRGRMR